jgi:hypothetical protein
MIYSEEIQRIIIAIVMAALVCEINRLRTIIESLTGQPAGPWFTGSPSAPVNGPPGPPSLNPNPPILPNSSPTSDRSRVHLPDAQRLNAVNPTLDPYSIAQRVTNRAHELKDFTRDTLRPKARLGDSIIGGWALNRGLIKIKDNSYLVDLFLGPVNWLGSNGLPLNNETKADRVEAAVAELSDDELVALLEFFRLTYNNN